MIGEIQPCLEKAVITASVGTTIAYVWRFKKFRADLRFISVTILCAQRAHNGAASLRAFRNRAQRPVFKYALMSEYASAAGRLLAVIAKMSTDLSADRGTVFTDLCSDTRKVPAKSKTSLDHKSVVICKMFHSRSFPAGYRENFTLIIGKRILKNGYGFEDNRRRAMDKCMDRQAAHTLIHRSVRKPVTHKLHSCYCDTHDG